MWKRLNNKLDVFIIPKIAKILKILAAISNDYLPDLRTDTTTNFRTKNKNFL